MTGYYYTSTDIEGENWLNLDAYMVGLDTEERHEVSWILTSDEHDITDWLTCKWEVTASCESVIMILAEMDDL